MKKVFLWIVLIPMLIACGNQQNAIQTAIAQTQAAMPTSTITPSPTPVIYKGAANQYLPTKSDIPSDYDLNTDSVAEKLNTPQSAAAVSYVTNRKNLLIGAHDGSPVSFIYFVRVLENKGEAVSLMQGLIEPSKNDALFSIIAPEVGTGTLGHATSLNVEIDDCQDLKAYKAYENLLAPTVYIATICRIENVVGIYWSDAIDNYDGQGQRIPDEVLIQQTQELVSILAQTIK